MLCEVIIAESFRPRHHFQQITSSHSSPCRVKVYITRVCPRVYPSRRCQRGASVESLLKALVDGDEMMSDVHAVVVMQS